MRKTISKNSKVGGNVNMAQKEFRGKNGIRYSLEQRGEEWWICQNGQLTGGGSTNKSFQEAEFERKRREVGEEGY